MNRRFETGEHADPQPDVDDPVSTMNAELLAAVADLLPVGIGVTDPEGNIRSMNSVAAKAFGMSSLKAYPRGAEAYRRILTVTDQDGQPLPPEQLPVSRASRGERVKDQQLHIRLAEDGSERVVSVSAQSLVVNNEELVVFVSHDITERERANEDLLSVYSLIEGITRGTNDLIAAEDSEFRYTFFNDAYRQEFKKLWGKDLVVGMNMLEALADWPEDQEKARLLWKRALDGESFSVTMSFGPTDDARQDYDLRFNPIIDAQGKLIGAAHILRNVTEQVRTQRALEKSERAMREADRRKDEFLAMLAHELRNPLAPIQSGIDLIKKGSSDENTLPMMERQTRHMVRLIEDLLDVSRISQGRISLQKEPVHLSLAVDNALQSLDVVRGDDQPEIQVEVADDLPPVDADPTRLNQIISNLLGNAIKFTSEAGQVNILAEADCDCIRLEIQDDGVGLEPDEFDRIFDLFDQGRASQGGGLGIGLTLVKTLVQLHEGTVEVHSDGIEKGSQFVVKLPLANAADIEPTPSGSPTNLSRNLAGRRIMVVDDNEDAANALGALLDGLGAITRVVFNARSAMDCFDKFSPRVVLLDIGLPDIDGFEVARWVRARAGVKDVKIIATTGWSQKSTVDRGRAVGIDEHLTKPVRLEDLIELLGRSQS